MIIQGDSVVITAEDALVLSEATRGREGWERLSPTQRQRFENIISDLRAVTSEWLTLHPAN